MSLGIARLVMKDEEQVTRFTEDILKLKPLRGEEWGVTSPEVIRIVWRKILEMTGEADPLREVKKEQNNGALRIYPFAKEVVLKSSDPLHDAVKFAIMGNSIDAMSDVKGGAPEAIIERHNGFKIRPEDLNCLKERLERSRRLVYLGDNCGEIIFDKLLIELLRERLSAKIIFVTRTLPVLNDATLCDAVSVGIGAIAQVMENGTPEPLPGTFLEKISPECKALIEESDLVISKGGGNYDSLTEEAGLRGKVSFLFQAKCRPYCSLHHVSLGAPILYHF
jgi:uncharacterized protein with ATP-grasp and redox domains